MIILLLLAANVLFSDDVGSTAQHDPAAIDACCCGHQGGSGLQLPCPNGKEFYDKYASFAAAQDAAKRLERQGKRVEITENEDTHRWYVYICK